MKIKLTIILLFLSGIVFGQNVPDYSRSKANGNQSQVDDRIRVAKTIYIPRGATPTLNGGKDSIGAVFYKTGSDPGLYVYAGSGVWNRYATFTDLVDTTSLSNRINTKVDKTTTVNGHALSSNVTVTKSDIGLGSVENTALSTWPGTTNITTLGTISAGTWHGTAITDTYISSAATWNAKENALTFSGPLSRSINTISIANAAADGSTLGAASFAANDFNASSGNISIDYTNGQAASGSVKGFLTAADWTTFNGKQAALGYTPENVLTFNGPLSRSTNTISIANAAADGSTKGAASFTASDFDASSGNISIDYTNGQAASGSVKGFLIAADWTTFNGKQAALGFTPENVANKATSLSSPSNTTYPTTQAVANAVAALSGTVTSVSVTTANGISGSVATATTTPAITLTLGAITPTRILFSGVTNGRIIGGTTDFAINNSTDAVNMLLINNSTYAATFAGAIAATNFSGSSSGTNTGDQTTISGNAATATALQTARNINGVAFDGTSNITVTAAAGTLTGSTLNSGVTASSLTSVGTITVGVWQGTAIADASIASSATWNAKQSALSGTGFVKISGTTISYDNSTYLTTSSAGSTYLPLAGGTLTGALIGTTGAFSVAGGGDVFDLNGSGAGTVNIRIAPSGASSNAARIRGTLNGSNTDLSFLTGGSATLALSYDKVATLSGKLVANFSVADDNHNLLNGSSTGYGLRVSGGNASDNTTRYSFRVSTYADVPVYTVFGGGLSTLVSGGRSWNMSAGSAFITHVSSGVVEGQFDPSSGGNSWLGATSGTSGSGSKHYFASNGNYTNTGSIFPGGPVSFAGIANGRIYSGSSTFAINNDVSSVNMLLFDNSTYAATFYGQVSGADPSSSGHFVTKGYGDSHYAATASAPVGKGSITLSGNGSTTDFNLGLSGSSYIVVSPASLAAQKSYYVTSVTGCGGLCSEWHIIFATAPANGSNNITVNYVTFN